MTDKASSVCVCVCVWAGVGVGGGKRDKYIICMYQTIHLFICSILFGIKKGAEQSGSVD